MDLLNFAKRELDIIGLTENSEDMDLEMRKDILDIIELFANQGHSGFSASYLNSILPKLMKYQPLSPLTGEDDEWTDVTSFGDDPVLQNKRCYSVFKGKDGKFWHNEAVKYYYEEDGEKVFLSPTKRTYITFPYYPKTEIVKIDKPMDIE